MPSSPHLLDMLLQHLARRLVDYRAHVDGEAIGLAHGELGHRALEHFDNAIGDFLLQAAYFLVRVLHLQQVFDVRKHPGTKLQSF